MQKTETADWPEPRSLKEELEEVARSRQTSVADLLEQIVREWLERSRSRKAKVSEEDDDERQQRLRAEVMKLAGTIEGEPGWAESVRSVVQANLARKYPATSAQLGISSIPERWSCAPSAVRISAICKP